MRVAVVWALLAALVPGCAALWEGELRQEGHRRIYVHEVQPGDTLSEIAARYGLRVDQLKRWNEIRRPRQLQVGTRLLLNPPDSDADAPAGPDRADGDTAATSAEARSREPPPPPDGQAGHERDWVWPADGAVQRSYATDSGGKSGIQIGGSVGDPVRAAAAGEVVYSGSGLRGYGNLIIVMHDERYLSAYGYNRELLVQEGEQVGRGEQIAEMGRSPGAEEASLHFEIRIDGEAVDPEAHLPERG